MSLWRRAYDAVPPTVQGLAVGLVGRWNYSKKFGSPFREAMGRLARNEAQRPEDLARLSADSIGRLLRFAKAEVPYYRTRPVSPEDLSTWPILDKSKLQEEPHQFLPGGVPRPRSLHLHTSGTTGAPLTIHCTPEAYQTEMAFRWRHKAWAGLPFGSRGAYIAGHPIVSPGRRKPPFWVFDGAENRLLLSSYHISEETAPSYLRELEKFAPEFLHGYPSSLHLLALSALQHGSEIRPRAVFTASETLLSSQLGTIERAFEAKVFNWYGQTELTCNIVECERGSLHVRSDYGFLEVLDDGSMVCTGFNNLAMPMIRYRTGDRIRLGKGQCGCGRPFPLVDHIEGRVEDYVVTPEGYLIGRLDHLFKGVDGVREAQIVQRETSALLLRIVREKSYNGRSEEHIRAEARKRLGPAMRLQFEYPALIERGAGGKFRFVVNECSRLPFTGSEDLLGAAGGALSSATMEGDA
jgi:phenylacetate-CoA ligase